jgi:hypothetical protein
LPTRRRLGQVAVAVFAMLLIAAALVFGVWATVTGSSAVFGRLTGLAGVFSLVLAALIASVAMIRWARRPANTPLPASGVARIPGPLTDGRWAGPGERRRLVRDEDPIALGIHRPEKNAGAAGLQAYVKRDVHDRLVALIRQGGFVLVQGHSAVGKTRLAWEAAGEAVPKWRIERPSSATDLAGLAHRNLKRTVVWLDNLERLLADGTFNASLLDKICPDGGTVTALATLRLTEKDRLLKEQKEAMHELLERADRRDVPVLNWRLTDDERSRAQVAAESDARLADALAHDDEYGFAPWLAGGPLAVRDWEEAKEGPHQVAAALISAAVDCRRAGHQGPVPKVVLVELLGAYLPAQYLDRADLPSLDAELEWACRSEHGTEPCLTALRGGDLYQVFDYLVDHVQRGSERDGIPGQVWDALVAHAAPEEMASIGVAALRRDRRETAVAAWTKGADNAQVSSQIALAQWLEYDDPAEAERLFRLAIEAGDTGARRNLASLLGENPFRLAEAEDCYKAAIKDGDDWAVYDLGQMLAEIPGREDEAERLLGRAVSKGIPRKIELGELLARLPGREAEAEEIFRRGLDDPFHSSAALSDLLKLLGGQPGREADLVELYDKFPEDPAMRRIMFAHIYFNPGFEPLIRRAVDDGDLAAMSTYAHFLSLQEGREEEAEALFRRSMQAGNDEDQVALAEWLASQQGREGDAEREFAAIVSRASPPDGNSNSEAAEDSELAEVLEAYGDLLASQPGRELEAEALFRRAGRRALTNLWELLARQPDREAEAAGLYRQFSADRVNFAVYTFVAAMVGALIDTCDLSRQAKDLFRNAVEAGDTRALLPLAYRVRHDPGGEPEAEALARRAVAECKPELVRQHAREFLGELLASQPGRELEAAEAFREAADAGSVTAMLGLGEVLTDLPGREAEAEAALRRAIEAIRLDDDDDHDELLLGLLSLAELITRAPGREEDAGPLLREALGILNGHEDDIEGPVGLFGLVFARVPGFESETRQFLRRALDEESAEKLSEPEEQKQIEKLARHAIASSQDPKARILAGILVGRLLDAQDGREAEAEEAFRDAAVTEDGFALACLGYFFYYHDRVDEAETALRASLDPAKTNGDENITVTRLVWLGAVIGRDVGRQAEAARTMRDALDLATASGTLDDHDALFFGTAMAGIPGLEAEAERFLRMASGEGNPQARSALDALLARQSAGNDKDLQTSG